MVHLRLLDNVSEEPEKGYEINNEQLVSQLATLVEEGVEVDRSNVTIWHTHPSGFVGPSREDMRAKAPDLNYLVVALPHGEATIF